MLLLYQFLSFGIGMLFVQLYSAVGRAGLDLFKLSLSGSSYTDAVPLVVYGFTRQLSAVSSAASSVFSHIPLDLSFDILQDIGTCALTGKQCPSGGAAYTLVVKSLSIIPNVSKTLVVRGSEPSPNPGAGSSEAFLWDWRHRDVFDQYNLVLGRSKAWAQHTSEILWLGVAFVALIAAVIGIWKYKVNHRNSYGGCSCG